MKLSVGGVVLLERDQGVAVLRPDGAGVLVGHVDAGERQPDIVDDIVELVGWDGTADCLFDLIEQASSLLDAGAGLGAHVHEKLAGINRREEVLAEEWPQPEGQQNAGEKSGDKGLRRTEREQQQRAVALADLCEAVVEHPLEALERIARAPRRRLFALRLVAAAVVPAHQVVGHCRHQRAREQERTDQREHDRLGQRPEQVAGDAAELNIGTNTMHRQSSVTKAGMTICCAPSMIAGSICLPCSRW